MSTFLGHDGDATVQRVAAVYADGGRLWFQVDGKRWEVAEVELNLEIDGSGASQFTVLFYGEVVIDIVYRGPTADPLNRRDPTFDALDLEVQDLFYFLARTGAVSSDVHPCSLG